MEESNLLSYSTSTQLANHGPSKPRLVELLGLVVVVSQVGSTILTPSWVDAVHQASLVHRANKSIVWIKGQHAPELYKSGGFEAHFAVYDGARSDVYNITSAYDPSHHIAGFFMLVFVGTVLVLCFGATLLVFRKLYPGKYITERELFYPKSEFVIVGVCSSLASLLMVYSSSGTRTAPYLQAIIANFSIPVTFITRFVLLRKRPTVRKLICGTVVLLAVLLSLLPTIFPQLEPHKAAEEDGGDSTGAGRVLWPFCMMTSLIPTAVSRCLVENNLKGEKKVYPTRVQINPIYFLFWQHLSATVTMWFLFWVDIIPGFGTSHNLAEFGRTLVFNTECIFGGGGCSYGVSLIVLLCLASLILQNLAIPLFLKYAEGTNYFVIVSSLQTPLVLLFWTLFTEGPFQWCPHLHLSTWLSIAAVCLILPALYIYSTGEPERSLSRDTPGTSSVEGGRSAGINSVLKYGSVANT